MEWLLHESGTTASSLFLVVGKATRRTAGRRLRRSPAAGRSGCCAAAGTTRMTDHVEWRTCCRTGAAGE
ncbi:MAG: hypothetical protein AW07_01586 [Candidatus Accumulibacter sp. SK-11]|nr:MAG: hypothetical protein AW07_01586 [Candidatus Accumulibacter sp. SK-11]